MAVIIDWIFVWNVVSVGETEEVCSSSFTPLTILPIVDGVYGFSKDRLLQVGIRFFN